MSNKAISANIHKYFKEIEQTEGIWSYIHMLYTDTSFSDEMQSDLYNLEETSWWFQYRAEVIRQIAELHFRKDKLIFDVGGGNGYTTCCMQNRGYGMVLLEPSYEACKNARKRGIVNVICGTLEEENVRDSSIEQMMLLDVLEHIEEDTGFLDLISQKLVRHGKVLITVPAFQVLWSSEDDRAGHYRRYTLRQLRKRAEDAGFRVCYINYFFSFLFLPILFIRVGMEKIGVLKRTEKRSAAERKKIDDQQFRERTGIVQAILNLFEKAEFNKLKKNKNIRFGSSILCVLEKGSSETR